MNYDWKEQQPYAYWLAGVEGLGNKSRHELVEYMGTPRAVFEREKEWKELLPEKKVKLLEKKKRESDIEGLYDKFRKGSIRFIPWGHPEYPQRLAKIPDPPYSLFVWGCLPEKEIPAVAVIGARQCSEYGSYVAQQYTAELAKKGINVISGMARGIDGIAHESALKAGANTYAVLGCGVDICYPSGHRRIYEEMKKRGGVISEYMPGTQPRAGLFPMRNRIISGLSDVVVIVEAREKSGTLITADMALEQGKEVYVVPGRVTDPLSQGCNRLIEQGAGIVASISSFSIDEMLKGIGWMQERKMEETLTEMAEGTKVVTAGEKQELLQYLDYYPKSIEQLQRESGMEYRQLVLKLTEICMEEQAVQVSANHYIRR